MYRHLPGIRLIMDSSWMEMAFLLPSFQIYLTAERRHERVFLPSSELHLWGAFPGIAYSVSG